MTYNLLHEIVDHYRHPGAMTELKSIKSRLFRIYETAEQIDVADLLLCSDEVQAQYASIMNTWRRIHTVIDSVTSQTPENELEIALERCNALLASLPSWQNK
jgi:hypothetical protein